MSPSSATLLIDAGNTRIKFGLLPHLAGRRAAQTLALTHAELGRLPAWLASRRIRPVAALGVSVAGEAVSKGIADLVMREYQVPVRWVRSARSAAGILNLYDEPGQLGSDRWVALVGLAAHTPEAALLASFGTATTIDALSPAAAPGGAPAADATAPEHDSSGTPGRRFEGGVILPGPELMLRSLANGTAQLPYAEGAAASLPRNTHAAIRSGVVAAQAGAVLRQWRAAMDALRAVPRVYCTGGGWPLVADEVAAELARCRLARGLPPDAPQWLDAPVLDGLASLAALET